MTRSQDLLQRAEKLIDLAIKAGADKADAVVARQRASSVSVRNGKVDSTSASEADDFNLRVFVGQRVGSVSAGHGADEKALAERAVSMARVSPEDEFACLADESLLAKDWPDLDLYDPTEPGSDALTDAAMVMEETALAVPGVTASVAAGASAGMVGLVLATSHGFAGSYQRSGFGRSVSVIAGEGTKMERDYDFDSRVFFSDLDNPELIGRNAGERAAKRVNPRRVPTGSNMNVVFDPRVSRGLIGHLVGAINGASVARKTSFLKDRMGEQVAISGLTINDNPHLPRRPGSRPFDGEGVASALSLKKIVSLNKSTPKKLL